MRWVIFTTTLLLAASWTTAVLKAQTLVLTTIPFNEKAHETARISGQLVAGVQVKSAPDDTILLHAYIPRNWAGKTVCSRVVSVDGLYEASNEYEVARDWPGATAQLPHPTSQPQMLSGKAADAVGVRVSLSSCENAAEEVTIAAWSGARQAPALLINSFQADVVFAYIDGATVPIRCEPIVMAGRSAYDTRCALDDIGASGRVEVKLLRIMDGKPAPQSRLFLWLP